MNFGIAFSTVLTMLIYALPGFLMIKSKILNDTAISAFAKLLMYVCSPMLTVYSLLAVDFSLTLLRDMGLVLLFMIVAVCSVILTVYFIIRKKSDDARYRIYSLASCMGNYAFMGVPILQALLPEYNEALVFSAMASLALNMIGWTLGSSIITKDIKYISLRKILLNPTIIALVAAFPLFVMGISLPDKLDNIVTTLGKMTTPLCMLIMGMRLAKTSFKSVFAKPAQYVIIAVKQIVVPLVCLGLLSLVPIDPNIKATVYILMCCPVASVVLNFAEMLGEGQETAAGLVLLGTTLSTLTIPVMVMLL